MKKIVFFLFSFCVCARMCVGVLMRSFQVGDFGYVHLLVMLTLSFIKRYSPVGHVQLTQLYCYMGSIYKTQITYIDEGPLSSGLHLHTEASKVAHLPAQLCFSRLRTTHVGRK